MSGDAFRVLAVVFGASPAVVFTAVALPAERLGLPLRLLLLLVGAASGALAWREARDLRRGGAGDGSLPESSVGLVVWSALAAPLLVVAALVALAAGGAPGR
jgi:hypothetical protein